MCVTLGTGMSQSNVQQLVAVCSWLCCVHEQSVFRELCVLYFSSPKSHRKSSLFIPARLRLVTVINFDNSWVAAAPLHPTRVINCLCIFSLTSQLALSRVIKLLRLISRPRHPRIWVCVHPDSDRSSIDEWVSVRGSQVNAGPAWCNGSNNSSHTHKTTGEGIKRLKETKRLKKLYWSIVFQYSCIILSSIIIILLPTRT